MTAARSPWQNPYAERLIGSLRRECLDPIIVLDEVHLREILAKYFEYYNGARCHLSLAGDAPEPWSVQGPELGEVVEFPEVGGLHHRYERGWRDRAQLAGSGEARTDFSARTTVASCCRRARFSRTSSRREWNPESIAAMSP